MGALLHSISFHLASLTLSHSFTRDDDGHADAHDDRDGKMQVLLFKCLI